MMKRKERYVTIAGVWKKSGREAPLGNHTRFRRVKEEAFLKHQKKKTDLGESAKRDPLMLLGLIRNQKKSGPQPESNCGEASPKKKRIISFSVRPVEAIIRQGAK